MRPLVQSEPDNDEFRKALADYGWFVVSNMNMTDPAKAKDALQISRESFGHYQKLYEKHPRDLRHLTDYIAACESLGAMHRFAGQAKEAEKIQALVREPHVRVLQEKCRQIERNLARPRERNRQSLIGLDIAFEPQKIAQLRHTQQATMLLAMRNGNERFRWLEAAEDCLDLALALSASSHTQARQQAVDELRRVQEILKLLKKQAPLSPAESELDGGLKSLLKSHVPPAIAESPRQRANP